jgi:hypothetical protein
MKQKTNFYNVLVIKHMVIIAISMSVLVIILSTQSKSAFGESSNPTNAEDQTTAEPFTLMGIKPGMSFPEVDQVAINRLRPEGWAVVLGGKGCSNYTSEGPGNNETPLTKGWTAAGIAMCDLIRDSKPYGGYEHLFFYFVDDKLAIFSWNFNHKQFNEVVEKLTKKYESSSNLVKTQTQVANRVGAVLPCEVFVWKNGVSTVVLSEYSSELDSSEVTVKHDALAAEFEQSKPSTTPNL